jgi:hypothetical protein
MKELFEKFKKEIETFCEDTRGTPVDHQEIIETQQALAFFIDYLRTFYVAMVAMDAVVKCDNYEYTLRKGSETTILLGCYCKKHKYYPDYEVIKRGPVDRDKQYRWTIKIGDALKLFTGSMNDFNANFKPPFTICSIGE